MSEHGCLHYRSAGGANKVPLVLPVVVPGVFGVLGFVEVALLVLGPLLDR